MFRFGLYRHWKGTLYVADNLVMDSESQDMLVIYWSLKAGPTKKWARDKDMFLEEVKWPDGVKRPRFLYEDVG